MKNRFGKIAALALLLAAVLAIDCAMAAADSIKWYSYEQGRSLARDKGLKVIVNFYADWCHYCKKMEKETFADPAVISYVNRHFVPIRINSDKEKKLASSFRVRSLPATFFIAEDGAKIGQLPGYVPPQNMLILLKYIGTDSYRSMSLRDFASRHKSSK